jgi:hypothetical protein
MVQASSFDFDRYWLVGEANPIFRNASYKVTRASIMYKVDKKVSVSIILQLFLCFVL